MLIDKIKLDDNEQILKQARKHWFILFTQMFSLAIVALFPLFIFIFLKFFVSVANINLVLSEYTYVLIYVYAAWLLIVWMMIFSAWTDYYLDIWTITNKRLIAIDQRGLFSRSVGSFRLERLQDLNIEINGIIATFLDFGTIEAQTAGGSEEEFTVHGYPNPRELKSIIMKAADKRIKSQNNIIDFSGV